MTQRSTRNKMRWQMKQVIDKIDSCFKHLKLIEEMSGEGSPLVNEFLNQYIYLFDQVRRLCIDFREKL